MLKVLYFVHDLSDPAVRRRVLTLKVGGAEVTLAGFRRGENALAAVEGMTPVELGQTHDGRFGQRLAAIGKSMLSLGATLRGVARPDVIIARNLEMLALASRAVSLFGGGIPIAYECLDIHRLLLRQDAGGKAIRAVERYLGKNARLLMTSSPAFVDNYFRRLSGLKLPVLLLENKVLMLDDDAPVAVKSRVPQPGQPWKIGWFGALRCRKSLAILSEFSRRMDGRFEIVLRGRPARSEFDDFDALVAKEPFLHFEGPYRNPEDLSRIYNEVQFSWAIDFFEEGQNSNWLLPNRLYEGCLHGAVPIAADGTETARFVTSRKIGLTLEHVNADGLVAALGDMDEQRYLAGFDAVTAQSRHQWITDRGDCATLVHRLASLSTAQPSFLAEAVSQPHGNKGGLL